MSLGATGAIGKILVFMSWKGINDVRSYVVPANPKSNKQTIQRGYLTNAVTAIHVAEAHATKPLTLVDKIAESLFGSVYPTPRTWFNTICKKWLNQQRATKKGVIYRSTTTTPTSGQIVIVLYRTEQGANTITAGDVYYGLTKTSMPNKVAAVIDAVNITGTITGLTNLTKYFMQFRPTAHADFVSCNSGIYTDIPKA